MTANQSDKSRIMQAITGLTAAYVIALAAVMTSGGQSVNGVLIDEAVFASPMLIAYALSRWVVHAGGRIILLGFEILFSIFTIAIFYWTFTGEHDAQYQLVLLAIPLFGFPTIVIVGAVAASIRAKGTG